MRAWHQAPAQPTTPGAAPPRRAAPPISNAKYTLGGVPSRPVAVPMLLDKPGVVAALLALGQPPQAPATPAKRQRSLSVASLASIFRTPTVDQDAEREELAQRLLPLVPEAARTALRAKQYDEAKAKGVSPELLARWKRIKDEPGAVAPACTAEEGPVACALDILDLACFASPPCLARIFDECMGTDRRFVLRAAVQAAHLFPGTQEEVEAILEDTTHTPNHTRLGDHLPWNASDLVSATADLHAAIRLTFEARLGHLADSHGTVPIEALRLVALMALGEGFELFQRLPSPPDRILIAAEAVNQPRAQGLVLRVQTTQRDAPDPTADLFRLARKAAEAPGGFALGLTARAHALRNNRSAAPPLLRVFRAATSSLDVSAVLMARAAASLRDAIDRAAPCDTMEKFLVDVARGLSVVHAAGLVACDLSASNVLIFDTKDEAGKAKQCAVLGDLAYCEAGDTHGRCLGAVGYGAGQGHPAVPQRPSTRSTDWYCFAKLCFDALTEASARDAHAVPCGLSHAEAAWATAFGEDSRVPLGTVKPTGCVALEDTTGVRCKDKVPLLRWAAQFIARYNGASKRFWSRATVPGAYQQQFFTTEIEHGDELIGEGWMPEPLRKLVEDNPTA